MAYTWGVIPILLSGMIPMIRVPSFVWLGARTTSYEAHGLVLVVHEVPFSSGNTSAANAAGTNLHMDSPQGT